MNARRSLRILPCLFVVGALAAGCGSDADTGAADPGGADADANTGGPDGSDGGVADGQPGQLLYDFWAMEKRLPPGSTTTLVIEAVHGSTATLEVSPQTGLELEPAGPISIDRISYHVLATPEHIGDYTVTLTVTDDASGREETGSVTLEVVNDAPTIDSLVATPDAVHSYATATLQVNASNDDAQPLAYRYEVIGGSATLDGSQAAVTGAMSSVAVAVTDLSGAPATIEVTVTDAFGASTSGTVDVTGINTAPELVDPTASIPVLAPGGSVDLHSAATDADEPVGDSLTWLWTVEPATAGTISAPDDAQPWLVTFTASADLGNFTITTTVSDTYGASVVNTVDGSVVNEPPTIASLVAVDAPVALGGTTALLVEASDEQGIASYVFDIVGGTGLLGGTDTADGKTFTASDSFGEATVRVVVTDTLGLTAEATVQIGVGSWSPVGAPGFSGGPALYVDLDFDASNAPWVAYSDSTLDDRATVKRFDDATQSWVTVGAPGVSDGAAFFVDLAMGVQPYVVFGDGDDGPVEVHAFDGTSWSELMTAGGQSAGFSFSDWSRLTVDADGLPYLCYRDSAGSYGVSVKRRQTTPFADWVYDPDFANGANISGGQVYWNAVTLGTDGVPIMAYGDNASPDGRVSVRRRVGASWQLLGDASISMGSVEWLGLDDGPAGTYVVFHDYSDTVDTVTVMRLEGGTWVRQGGNIIAPWSTYYADIAQDADGPYVIFNEQDYGNRATALRLDPATDAWVAIGGRGFSAGSAAFTRIEVRDGVIYAAYSDNTAGGVIVQTVQ